MNLISPLAKISSLTDIEKSTRGSSLTIKERTFIDSFVKIKFAGGYGNIVIEEDVYINSGVVLYSGNGIFIGRGSLVAANVTIAATNHQYKDRSRLIREQGFMDSKGGIVIEDDCWIGANSIILDGTILKRGSVVAAGTVVLGTWEPYSVVAGNPARLLTKRGN